VLYELYGSMVIGRNTGENVEKNYFNASRQKEPDF